QEPGVSRPMAEVERQYPLISLGGLENRITPPHPFPGTAAPANTGAPKIESFPLKPFQSLLSEITPQTPRRRAAALRLAEEGRKLLQDRRHNQALARFERAMALEASAYNYYYLALAHHRLAHYRESLNFLEVAESWLNVDPRWLAEISALRRENLRALEASRPDGASASRASHKDSKPGAQAGSRDPPEADQLLFALDVGVGFFLVLCAVWSLRYRSLPWSDED
ncbi:MAG: hypothetical protein ACREP8_09450, partial [Candidatus Binatia bacterium]